MIDREDFVGVVEAGFADLIFRKRIGAADVKQTADRLKLLLLLFKNDYPDCVECFEKDLKKLMRAKNVANFELSTQEKRRSNAVGNPELDGSCGIVRN